jgi:hypothetical protein
VGVPVGYVFGTPLGTSTDTWNGATFASLGVTPSTYKWTWETGADADSTIRQDCPSGKAAGNRGSGPSSSWTLANNAALRARWEDPKVRHREEERRHADEACSVYWLRHHRQLRQF